VVLDTGCAPGNVETCDDRQKVPTIVFTSAGDGGQGLAKLGVDVVRE
jgi:hypothetical protein